MGRKIVALFLCLAMTFGLMPSMSFATSTSLKFETELAEDLKELGLFKGVSDTDFALNRAPTRTEALVMLIRVLGKESDALSKGGKHPFLDVPAWADKYVGYAYENKLTNGISATKFGGSSVASSSMYLTFVLRALGYSDVNGADFTWDNPFTLARQTGVLLGNPDTINFRRADVVLVSYAALEAEVKGSGQTLAQKLITAGAISAAAYDKYYNLSAFENTSDTATRELAASEIYEKCSPAVFYIEVFDKDGKAFALGSGFFIDSDGTAVTNYHVIDGAYSARIKRSDNGKTYKVLGIYDYSPITDWAVIKVDGKDFPYLKMDETPLKGGEEIFTIGNPQGLENTISEGLVSNPQRPLDGVPYIQISAPISSGSSGGALLNKHGHVVGITTAGFEEGQNLNLALPISIIKNRKQTTIHPFSALVATDDGMPFGSINLDVYPEDERALELLRMWIFHNQNKTMTWGPGVIDVYDLDDGTQIQYIYSYNDIQNEIVVQYNEFGADNSYTLRSELSFDTGTQAVLKIEFQQGIGGDVDPYYPEEEINEYGVASIPKQDIKADLSVYLSPYYGDSIYKNDVEKMAASICLSMLENLEYIIVNKLSGYDVDGVRALGFTKCWFY